MDRILRCVICAAQVRVHSALPELQSVLARRLRLFSATSFAIDYLRLHLSDFARQFLQDFLETSFAPYED